MIAWQLGAFVVLGLALLAGFAWYERTHPSSRVLALVATLAALAALGRVAFAPIPSVKPTLDIILIAGLVLGAAPGFAVGAIGALASNLFFGQGPWTPWQMAIFGGLGVAGAALGALTGRRIGRVPLAVVCGIGGYACGMLLDVSTWATFGSGDRGQLGAILARGVPFDLGLAAGNVVFALAFGPALVKALARFRDRMDVTWHPAGATLGVALVALAIAPAAHGASDLAGPVAYLRGAQNADGGFGPAKGAASTPLHTAWAALGLAAAGRAPSPATVDYIRRDAPAETAAADLERTILALRAGGAPAGDLVTKLLRKRAPDGSFNRQVNVTAFAVFALRAGGRTTSDRAVKGAAAWIARQQNRDGGFSFDRRGGPSGIDDTAAALQALVAGGRPRRTVAVKRAGAYLAAHQNADGGFPLAEGAASNAQSTAWAVQGLLAAGRDPSRVRRRGSRSPLAYLRSLVGPDGSVRYSRVSRQTPVWVTAQALTALARQPFPIRPVGAQQARASAAPAPWTALARLGGVACAALLAIARLD